MEALKKERTLLRSSVTRTCTKISSILKKPGLESSDRDELEGLYSVLLERFQELRVSDEKMLNEQKDEDEKVLESEQGTVDEYATLYFKTKKLCEKVLENKQEDGCSERSTCSSQKQQVPYKLPPLKLKEFSGDLGDWLPFWAQFEKIHLDPNMPAVDKLGYLSMCVVKDSPAQRVINSFPATGDLYPEIIGALEARFGRKDLLTEYYIRELLRLVLSNISSDKKISVVELHDELQCHLRNLEVLGVTAENQASILMPLVSSCLPSYLLQLWERSQTQGNSSEDNLKGVMEFLRKEVEGSQKMKLAASGFGISSKNHPPFTFKRPHTADKKERLHTASALAATTGNVSVICIFCDKDHRSTVCGKLNRMTMQERREAVQKHRACFICLQTDGHRAYQCRVKNLKCGKCSGNHYEFLCSNLSRTGNENTTSKNLDLSSVALGGDVAMQTLVVDLIGKNNKMKPVKVLIDTGSQRSYVSKKCAKEMGYMPTRQVSLQHILFGGTQTEAVQHDVYHINLSSISTEFMCNFDALGQEVICGSVSSVPNGPWMQELAKHHIELSDVNGESDIDILVGSDISARIWTGNRVELTCGLVAMETRLGWTLSGKIPNESKESIGTTCVNLFVREAAVADLWSIDVLGITDPMEKKQQADIDYATEEHFKSTVCVNNDSRFEIRLPFVDTHPPLSSNYNIARSRLQSIRKRLITDGYLESYGKVLEDWEHQGIIEEVPKEELDNTAYYLPHRHVVKEGSTTPVRPVFDASCKEGGSCSLNECLEKGPNLIAKIPAALAKFRKNKIGISGDIAKAFLQISVHPKDRDYLRFLWENENSQLRVMRHCRTVFGVSSSPFLLESCIKLHLQQTLQLCKENKSPYPHQFIELLEQNFYVDNCLSSLDSLEEAREFIQAASLVMMERKFELRGWEVSGEVDTKPTNVLGLLWNKERDTLSISNKNLLDMDLSKITKKVILSAAHRVFDPVGIVCGFGLVPKLLLQETWKKNLTWNEEVDEDVKERFIDWLKEVPLLSEIEVPRWAFGADTCKENITLHIFSDASGLAYASAVFVRVEHEMGVTVRLLAARARVAPTSKSKSGMTIPRLELLAASIGTRLYQTVLEDYKLKVIRTIFWTDATTVLAWIKNNEPWNSFVMNRVKEIRVLSENCEWRHVPGTMNPADIPSRGSTLKKLLQCTWWEGPEWLKGSPNSWPQQEEVVDEKEVMKELKKTVVSAVVSSVDTPDTSYYEYFSSYTKLIRMVAWIQRFKENAMSKKRTGKLPEPHDLTADEFKSAELTVFRLIQRESPTEMKKMECTQIINEENLQRLKTKISYRNDDRDFCYPIVLPAGHPVVRRMVLSVHRESCHAGSQTLLAILRQRFWLIGGRRAIRSILNTCIVCRRYSAPKVQAEAIPLPEPRVRDARTFEVTGVDLAGPLFVKNDRDELMKVWICIFTCAVYRAVKLELVWSLSTDSFTQALRRFISRSGRPEIIYSDNGKNFIGFHNVSCKLDWDEIAKYCATRKIQWRFNPPSAPWWGGFWERLIGILKPLLKRVLGNATVSCEELLTILSDCEAVINSRPISYMSEDKSDLSFLTPNMFLHDIQESGVPEYDLVHTTDLTKRHKYRQEVVYELRKRFRVEYLGQLQLLSKKSVESTLEVGELVLIGDENVKRVSWPVGRVEDLVTGKDNQVRVVKVRTAQGMVVRPVQRVYRLEIAVPKQSDSETVQPAAGPNQASSGVDSETVQPVAGPNQASSEVDSNVGSSEQVIVPMSQRSQEPDLGIYSPLTTTRHGRHVKRPFKLDL